MSDWILLNCPRNCWPNASLCDNTSFVTSDDLYDHLLHESRFWIQRVLIPIVVVVGVLGNGLTVIVLSRRRMRSSTNTYLTGLAISDLLYLLFVFTLSLKHYPHINDLQYYIYWIYRPYAIWLVDATTSISIWLTVTFTLERYIAVCHPMRGRLLCTETRARIAIVFIYILCFLATGSTSFEWKAICFCNACNGLFNVDESMSELGNDDTYQVVYYRFWSISCVFLPIILIAIFNTFLVLAVHKSTRTRRQMTQRDLSSATQRMENKITITLIAVVIMFMVCQIPTAIILMRQSFYNYPHTKLLLIFNNIANFLVVINAAANFILYTALSGKYRRTLIALFTKKCRCFFITGNHSPSSGNTTENNYYNTSRFTRGTTVMSTLRVTSRKSPTNRTNGMEQTAFNQNSLPNT